MTRGERADGWSQALFLGLALALLVQGTPAWGQRAAPAPAKSQPTGPARPAEVQKKEFPLHISAAQMEADQDQRFIVFKGQVKADYGDAILYTDHLVVFFKPPQPTRRPSPPAGKSQAGSPFGDLGGDEIDRIEARGNVRFVQGDRVATGERSVYFKDKNEIVLWGRPQVWRGENHLKGSKITFNLASKKVEVESSPEQRVEAHLYPTPKTAPESFSAKGPRAAPRTGRPK